MACENGNYGDHVGGLEALHEIDRDFEGCFSFRFEW